MNVQTRAVSMESISATIAQCPYLVSAEHISLPESPVSETAFQWNAVPSLSERHQVRSTLSQICGDLAVLDDTLAHIASIQTRLLEKRESLQVFSDKLNGLISPIRTTPPEILAEIFSYLKGDYCDKGPAYARAVSLFPTHVCQQWRQIALSIPSLWDSVYISGGSISESIRNSEVECIKTWLARAKDCPLSINLRRVDSWWDDNDFQTDYAYDAIFKILLQHSHRWQHAILVSTSGTDFSSLRNNLPLLETLEIDCPVSDHTIIVGNAFEIAPRLSNVTISSGTINILPWAQLKVFTTDVDLSILQSLTLLQQMPNIISFHTETFYNESEMLGTIGTPLQMSKLERLSVLDIAMFSMARYLRCLTLPSLTSIKLSSDGPHRGVPDDWVLATISMIQQSSCSIKSLEVTSGKWDGQATLGDLFRVTPQLQTFHIGWNTEYDFGQFVGFLMAPLGTSSTACLAPKLQHIKLLYLPPFEPQAFVDMVNSRWRVTPGGSIARLGSIELFNIPSATIFDSSHLEHLGEFAAEGLDIKLNDVEGKPILFEIGSMSA